MDQNAGNVHARITSLEQQMVDVQRSLREIRVALAMQNVVTQDRPSYGPIAPPQGAPATVPSAPPPPIPVAPPFPQAAPLRPVGGADIVRGGEYWFSRIGIGLFLLGLAFLFKYAIDQGWLTPVVRVGIGLFAGVVLLAIGLWVRDRHPHFAPILQGGGIAAFYITDFAAFQLYELVNYPAAFGFMCAVTALTFGLAVWQNVLVLGIIAAVGGLATPFILYTDTGSATGLVIYTSLILAGIAGICIYCRWRPLLWVGAIGGWLVLLSTVVTLPSPPVQSVDRWAVQFGIIWISLFFWPLLIVLLRKAVPPAVAYPTPRNFTLTATDFAASTFVTPFLLFLLTTALWQWSKVTNGWFALALAAVVGTGWLVLRGDERVKRIAYAHIGTAILLLTMALLLLFDGNARLLALAIEAAVLHWLAERYKDVFGASFAHLLFIGLMFVVVARLGDPAQSPALIHLDALTNAAIIGLIFATSWAIHPPESAPAYWLVAHLLLLGFTAHELLPLADGHAYLTTAWGIYGAVLLVIGLRWDSTASSLFGMGTLLVVVAKLLLIDLAALAAIWRILLFLGFGTVFLIFGYYLRILWRPKVVGSAIPEDETT